MLEFDAESLTDQVVMLGLVSQDQAFRAKADAPDSSPDAVVRTLLRKGWITSWQIERLQKGDPSGFFYGGCKVLFHLAEGTFARVYRGERVSDGQPVAVKVLRQRFVADPDSVMRFHKEAEAGMRLSHPNIVQIIDYGDQERRHYMIMEYVEGSNMRELLRIRNRIDPTSSVRLMSGLTSGLKYSHESGVTHRDIKPTNILISNTGVAKLVDFGLATIESEDKKMAALNQRTVDYSALERTCGSQKGDPRSDVFFLGCVFYQMLTGLLPMAEVESKDPLQKMLKRSFGAIKPISEQRNAPDQELCNIVERMMRMDLKARYQSMAEVLKDIEWYENRQTGAGGTLPALAGEVADEEEPIFLSVEEAEEAELPEEPAPPAVKAAPAKQILCVEKQSEIQDAFRKILAKMGYRVFLVADAELAAERYRESPPDAVIFDADGLGEGAIEAFLDMHDKAHEDGHDLAALVLLGPKQHALKEKLPSDDRLIVLGKPIKMKQVQDAIAQLLPVG